MKKLLLTLGSAAAAVAPIATTIACSEDKPVVKFSELNFEQNDETILRVQQISQEMDL